MKIKNKKTIKYTGPVHDLTISNSHTYNVECLGVHNSVAGSLIAYLIGITEVDPIPYDLMLSRFYDPEKASLPDIDIDFPPDFRDAVIQYITRRYGEEKVSGVVTFGGLQGRGAIKEVLRIHNVCDEETKNRITKSIPQRDKISDKLEEDKEDSILRWTLNNMPNQLKEWCEIKDGKLTGQYAPYFEIAIRLESTFKSYGKHASALVLTYEPLIDCCPTIVDKSTGKLMSGVEYTEMEELGHLKMDILGLSVTTKLMYANQLIGRRSIESLDIK